MRVIFIISFCFFGLVGYSQTKPNHINNIINLYAGINSFNPCNNSITASSTAGFFQGDIVLIIQMKGAIADSSNTANFGNVLDYKNSGNYEFNYIKSISGNTIKLKNNLIRNYDFLQKLVQVIRVPSFNNLEVSDPLSCLPWNGATGGVLTFIVKDTLTLYSDINVSASGFRGGTNLQLEANSVACSKINYYADLSSVEASMKGEGIATLKSDKLNGRGKLSNGGGGGNGQSSGGGGGGNNTSGGKGGYQIASCGNAPFDNGGIGGAGLVYSNTINKIFLGGGGGAGQLDSVENGFFAAGGRGGGIIIIKAKYLKTNNFSLSVAGQGGEYCYSCHTDGRGGGGAAGTMLLNIENYLDSVSVNLTGGNGAFITDPLKKAGPGGGGSGGLAWFTGNIPLLARIYEPGGMSGFISNSSDPYGSMPGNAGTVLSNLNIPVDSITFNRADSLSIKDSAVNCTGEIFKGIISNNTFQIISWHWNFGDGVTDSAQNTFHIFQNAGDYLVKLTAVDIKGCIDTGFSNVLVLPLPNIRAIKSNDIDCSNNFSQLNATGGITYVWKPAPTLNDPDISNPKAMPLQQTMYIVRGMGSNGCFSSDSVIVEVKGLNKSVYMLPSAFTPNNDAFNDCFGLKNIAGIRNLDFKIFNRWGQLLFHTNRSGECWDGNYKGVPQDTGNYIYIIKAQTTCGDVQKKGDFLLLR